MIEKFIESISWWWELIVEYNRDCKSHMRENDYDKLIRRFPDRKNLFFAWGIIDPTKNRSRSNVWFVNKISIDIDFRKQFIKEKGKDCDDEYIQKAWLFLWEQLKEKYPEDLWQWRFIVASGNWLHIHYFGKILKISELQRELYREACIDIYEYFNDQVDNVFEADMKVGDIWHLFRLPWSLNEKNDIVKECKIIAYQDIESDLVNKLPRLMELASNRMKKREFEALQKQKEFEAKNYSQWENIFEKINREIPVAEVIQIFIPERKLKADGKNFTNPAKRWNVNASYFVDKRNNVLIRNWSTKLPWTQEWFSPTLLVKEFLWTNWKWVLTWFEKNWFIKL